MNSGTVARLRGAAITSSREGHTQLSIYENEHQKFVRILPVFYYCVHKMSPRLSTAHRGQDHSSAISGVIKELDLLHIGDEEHKVRMDELSQRRSLRSRRCIHFRLIQEAGRYGNALPDPTSKTGLEPHASRRPEDTSRAFPSHGMHRRDAPLSFKRISRARMPKSDHGAQILAGGPFSDTVRSAEEVIARRGKKRHKQKKKKKKNLQ